MSKKCAGNFTSLRIARSMWAMKKKTPEGQNVSAIADYLALIERKGTSCWFLVRNSRLTRNSKGQVFARKMGGPLDKKGISDICGCYKSIFVGLEVKADTKQSDDQKQFQKSIEKAGGRYFVVRSIDDVIRALATVDMLSGLHAAFMEIINEREVA